MDWQHALYLTGSIVTFCALFFFGYGLWWQIKTKRQTRRRELMSNHGHGIKDYYNVFIYYIFAFLLLADFLGMILFILYFVK